jgi:hypothetical protein
VIIVINDRQEVRLEDPLDNKRFRLEIRSRSTDLASLAAAFAPYGKLESREHAWVDTNALRQWKGVAENPAYLTGLDAMLAYAAKKGWLDADGTRVRAHVVWGTSGEKEG